MNILPINSWYILIVGWVGAGLQYYLFLPYIFGEPAPTNRVYENTMCLI